MRYCILAYYKFVFLSDPAMEVARHHAFFQNRDACGRIYISTEGINGQMSATEEAAQAYIQWMREDERFLDIDFKIHRHHEHVFPRMTVKVRQQLVALDVPVQVGMGGQHVSPSRWRTMLEERDEDTLLLDVRNDYEWKVGHFEGADLPGLDTFRQFPEFAKKLKEMHAPKKTKVMMYCTGGIRCELYSALLKQEGFEKVYQLEGGIIKYGLEEGKTHWRGKLFVFDDRLSTPISEGEEHEVISVCAHCHTLTDLYFNCANMDCNELFLSCLDCAERLKGCCCIDCVGAPRVRAFEKAERPKPFRRRHHYTQCAKKEK